MSYLSPHELAELGVRAGREVKVSVDARVFGGPRIVMGDNVRIDAFCVLSAGAAGTITLGSHIHIASGARMFGEGGILMEDFSSVSAASTLYSASDDYSGRALMGPTIPARWTSVDARPVSIERFAAVGAHSLVLPGVTIHEGAVLGAMSLATSDLDAWTIHAGSPSRVLRARSTDVVGTAEQFLAEWSAERD